jgi:hypothetical protein
MAAKQELGDLVWRITGDPTNLNKNIAASKKNVGSFGSAIKKVAVAVGGYFAFMKAFDLGKNLIKAASDAEETRNKFNVVFKDVRKSADDAFKNLAANYGLARSEAQRMLANTGDMLTGFSFTGKAALELSNNTQKLAVDLASFANVDVATASEAITKGLLGEREMMVQLGIKIGEADLKQRLFEKGQDKLTGTALRQARAQATLELAYGQSGNAVDDFQKSMASFANQQRIAEAGVENLSVALGESLLPFANLVMTSFNKLTPSVMRIADSLREYVTSAEGAAEISSFLGTAAAALSAAFTAIETIFGTIGDVIEDVAENFVGFEGSILGTVDAFSFLGPILQTMVFSIRILGAVVGSAINAFTQLINLIMSAGDLVKTFAKTMSGDLSAAMSLSDKIDKTKEEFVGLGKVYVDGWGNIVTTAKEGFTNFTEESGKIADKARERAEKVSKETAAVVRTALVNASRGQEELTDNIEETTEAQKTFFGITEDGYKKMGSNAEQFQEKFEDTYAKQADLALEIMGTITEAIQTLMATRVEAVEAELESDLEALDARTQAQLEANGLLEESEIEKLENEKEAAILAGDEELAAEKGRDIQRLTILKNAEKQKAALEKQAAKKKADLEYKGAVAGWSFRLATALATAPLTVLSALTTGLQAPFPVGPVLGPVMAAAAGVAATLQIGAIAASKPQRPSFAVGVGKVPSDMTADIHKDEMIVPAPFADSVRDGEISIGGGEKVSKQPIIFQMIAQTGDVVKEWLFEGTQDGTVKIDSRAMVII